MIEYTFPSYSSSPPTVPQYLGGEDSGLILVRDESTNCAEVLRSPVVESPDVHGWTTDATFSYAVSQYGDLLGKLAD